MNVKSALGAAALAGFLGTAASAATVSETFGPAFSFANGTGGELTFSLSGLETDIASDLTIDFTVIGDLSWRTEYFTLSVDGQNFGRGCDWRRGNDSFGINRDRCSQRDNSFTDASLVIDQSTAAGLLADGTLELSFGFTNRVHAFVDITNGGETRSGVFFGNTDNFAFATGGTVSYDITPIPLPAGAPLLIGGLAAFAALRARRKANA